MKKKLKLPILLLAVVVMLSIFYIKEAQKPNETPTNSGNVETSTLNPEFTEARLQGINEVNQLIAELESKIASGTLSSSEVLAATTEIERLRGVKQQEASLEKQIIEMKSYDDVLVLLNEDDLMVDVYSEEALDELAAAQIALTAMQCFGSNVQIEVKNTNIDE